MLVIWTRVDSDNKPLYEMHQNINGSLHYVEKFIRDSDRHQKAKVVDIETGNKYKYNYLTKKLNKE